jgi:hypothetical protein
MGDRRCMGDVGDVGEWGMSVSGGDGRGRGKRALTGDGRWSGASYGEDVF